MENLTGILVFKTNIRTQTDIDLVRDQFDDHAHIEDWHIDTDDIDCVLRIVSEELTPEEIRELVEARGYQCIELE